MKKIAIITMNLYNGGAERIAGLLSLYLSKYYEMYLFLFDANNIIYDYCGTVVDCGKHGFECFEYYINEYKAHYNISCAISFLEPCNFMNVRTRNNEKVIISERNVQSRMVPKSYHEDYFVRSLYNHSDGIVSVSDGVKYDLVQNYGVKEGLIKTIYNFHNREKIRINSEAELPKAIKEFVGDDRLILNIGRLEPQKNHNRLLVQFSDLLKKEKNIKLIIVGEGDLEEELSDKAIELGIEKYVKVVRRTSNPFPFYRRADLFVLSSKFEGLPNVLIEAMSIGVPIVASDCISGPRELLSDNHNYSNAVVEYELCSRGVIVTNSETEDCGETFYMSEAMQYCLNNPDFCNDIIKNQEQFMENYSNRSFLREWLEMIEDPIINRKVELPINKRDICLFGAGKLARVAVKQFKLEKIDIKCIIVTGREGNPDNIEGVKVKELGDFHNAPDKTDIYLAVSYWKQSEIVKNLLDRGYNNIFQICLKPEC